MIRKTVILTRSRGGNAELSARLREIGLSSVAVDSIAFLPPPDWSRVDALLNRLATFDWLVLTSATGVRFFLDRVAVLGLRVPWLGKPAIAAVGPKTASALGAAGLTVKFVPSSFRTLALGDELPAGSGTRALVLRADIANEGLVERLRERGFEVGTAALYTTAAPKFEEPKDLGDASFIVFASPSAVRGFCSKVSPGELARLRSSKAVCIGPVTEAAAKEHGFSDTVTPSVYTLDAVVDVLARLNRSDI